jgi:D-lactate dehydrogenase (cytochrome)
MIVKTGREQLLSYLEDTSNIPGDASVLYIPQNLSELQSVIKDCADKKIPVTLSAGRTGTTGGCIALSGAIVSLEKFNAVLNIDTQNRLARLQAAVTLGQLASAAAAMGLKFSAASTEELSCIGGAVATCASGVRGFGYGSIRNYVAEIKVLLTSGELLNIRRGEIFADKRRFNFKIDDRRFDFIVPAYNMPKVKHQAGYFVQDNMDLIDLFIGSEGTLGVVVEVALKLQPLPAGVLDGLLFFDSENKALEFAVALRALKAKKSLSPVSLEYFDSRSLEFLKSKNSFIPAGCRSAIYFEHEAVSDKELGLLQDEFYALSLWHKAMLDESIFAISNDERKRIFEFRHSLPQEINEFLRRHKQMKVASDIAVPEHNFAGMYEYYLSVAESGGMPYVNFGHIGDCHLHFNFLPRTDEEREKAKELLFDLCAKAVALKGTISAEHGIGKVKKSYLKILYSESEIKEMAAVKKYFDPACILNLDNIFDKELLS